MDFPYNKICNGRDQIVTMEQIVSRIGWKWDAALYFSIWDNPLKWNSVKLFLSIPVFAVVKWLKWKSCIRQSVSYILIYRGKELVKCAHNLTKTSERIHKTWIDEGWDFALQKVVYALRENSEKWPIYLDSCQLAQ